VQTIIVGATQRYAVIDGRTVTQGDRVGEARVVRITESDVTLRDAAGRTSVIGLLPQVQKKSRPTALSDRSTAVP
jgi:MSHA biogenesis protein MshK